MGNGCAGLKHAAAGEVGGLIQFSQNPIWSINGAGIQTITIYRFTISAVQYVSTICDVFLHQSVYFKCIYLVTVVTCKLL